MSNDPGVLCDNIEEYVLEQTNAGEEVACIDMRLSAPPPERENIALAPPPRPMGRKSAKKCRLSACESSNGNNGSLEESVQQMVSATQKYFELKANKMADESGATAPHMGAEVQTQEKNARLHVLRLQEDLLKDLSEEGLDPGRSLKMKSAKLALFDDLMQTMQGFESEVTQLLPAQKSLQTRLDTESGTQTDDPAIVRNMK